MNKKFFSGDSVRQALLQAARYFQVEPEEVAYREVDRRHGFLRGRRRAVIEVDLENPLHPVTPDEATEARAADETVAEPVGPTSPPDEPPTEEMPTRLLAEAAGPSEPSPPERAPAEPPETAAVEPAESSPGAATVEPSEPLPGAAPSEPAADLAAAARQALGRIFELGRIDVEIVSIQQGEEKLEVELRGEDEDLLLEDRGRLLLAIQHLLPRMLRGLIGRSTPCLVDCDDFHEIRTEQLRDLAQRVASEVRNRRRSRTLEPMSPDERRIVHLTLADDPAVETVSQGNGLFKRVQIRPQKMQPRGFDPFGRE